MTRKYEVNLTNVPDGAYTEWYLGVDSRICDSYREAQDVVAGFRDAKKRHPENFEPNMEASIVAIDLR